MQSYGKTKRRNKLHPHNECAVCSEQGWCKTKARQANKHVVEEELKEYEDEK